MSERSNVRITQIGAGPAGTGLWLAAERIRRLNLIKDQGLLVLDQAPPAEIGVGYLKNFSNVRTNSQGCDLIACLPSKFYDAIVQTDLGRSIEEQGATTVSLRETGELQQRKGRMLKGLLGDSLVTNSHVESIVEVNNRGGKTYFTLDDNQQIISQSDVVVLATGAGESLQPRLEPFKDRVLLSRQVIGDSPRDPRMDSAKKIAVIGASHSGALVLQDILGSSDAQIDLIHRGEVLIHSTSKEAAQARGLPVSEKALSDDPDGVQPWRFKGTRGVAGDVLASIVKGDEPRVTKHDGSFTDFPEILGATDLIIQCTGLSWRPIPLYREGVVPAASLKKTGFLTRNDKIVINDDGNPYTEIKEYGEHVPFEQIFVVGMGSVGVTPDVENYQAINFYEGSMGEKRIRKILDSLDGSSPFSKKNLVWESFDHYVRDWRGNDGGSVW